jgi:hypothetical protein
VSVTFTRISNPGDNTLFTQHYNSIISGLATAANVSLRAIRVKSIVYASVILDAAVTTADNPATNNNFQNSISDYFNNLKINDMQIKASVVNPTPTPSPVPDNSSSGSNTTTIIAIVIPIVVVRIFFFI